MPIAKPLAIGRGTGRMLDKRGYVLALSKGHPRANRDGYVWEHVLVAEKALGHHILPNNPIHHVDGNPANNDPTNLVVCPDQGYHKLLHQRADALKACGDASALKCNLCHSYARQEEMREYINRGVGRCGRHLSCNRAHVRLSTQAKKKPLAVDLFCGLSGWGEGLIAEGYDVIGYDIEDMFEMLGESKPEHFHLVIQDVMALRGSQFRNADLIVASPPCQEFSWMAMPWSRAKRVAADYRSGVRDVKQLTALFDACFRIQREACEAAGRHIPLIVENVRGAIPWVGRSRCSFGSFHFWGDTPALWPLGTHRKQQGDDPSWFYDNYEGSARRFSSKSKERKQWSAEIAKIPPHVSTWIARCFKTDRPYAHAKIPLPLSRHIAAAHRLEPHIPHEETHR